MEHDGDQLDRNGRRKPSRYTEVERLARAMSRTKHKIARSTNSDDCIHWQEKLRRQEQQLTILACR